MTEEEFRKKLYSLEDDYIRAPIEVQKKLDDIADKYHVILNDFVNSEEFTKERYYELLDEFYDEYAKEMYSVKSKDERHINDQ